MYKQLCKLVNIFINNKYTICLLVNIIVFICKHICKQVNQCVCNPFASFFLPENLLLSSPSRNFNQLKNSPLDDRSKNRIILIH